MKKNNKWLMFLILLISAITVGVSQLKIAAVMQDVAAALGVSTTQAALLMSVFTIAGIVLAIPGAAIQDKMGPKNLLLLNGLSGCRQCPGRCQRQLCSGCGQPYH